MSKRLNRGQVALIFAAAGLAALWVSLRISKLGVTTVDSSIANIIAVAGAVAGIVLIAISALIMITKKKFLALNPFIVLGGYAAILVVVLQGAAYIVFLAITVGLNLLNY